MSRTAASSTYPAHAIVLRVRSLGEKDRIVTLLSPDHGKLSAVARGARGTKSRLAAVTQPFVLARFLIVRGRSLDIITQAEIEQAHGDIAPVLLKTAWATYLCELCDAMPEQLPDAELYGLLAAALGAMDGAPDDGMAVELIGRWFEAHYLVLLGYAPTIGHCVTCGARIVVPKADGAQPVAFSAALGGTLCASCARRDAQHLDVSAQSLRALRRLELAPSPLPPEAVDLASAASRDLRDCLLASLRAHLDLRLKSRSFLDDVAAAQPESQNDV